MSDEYEKLLDRLFDKLPKVEDSDERFQVPPVISHIQGSRTVISNFNKIADALGRKQEQLFKYVARELATPGDFKKNALILGSKIPSSRINEKIKQYCSEFVFCRVCNRPDTELLTLNKLTYLKCHACGAQNAVRAKI